MAERSSSRAPGSVAGPRVRSAPTGEASLERHRTTVVADTSNDSSSAPELLCFSRPECELCDVMRAQLEDLRREFHFSLREIDITGRAELEREYALCVPVLELEGRRLSEGRLDAERVRQALARHPGSALP